MNLKIAINLYYPPVQQLKSILGSNKDIYMPINGGSSLRNDEWAKENVIFDDTGDNISSKNKILNEMTSMYWIWKHYQDIGNPDYIGHNHYRRFFGKQDISDFKNYDMIISKPIFSSNVFSLAQQYDKYHNIEDLRTCIRILIERDRRFGTEFRDYLNLCGENYAPCNMFIMRKGIFFEWCEFLFPVLFELENRISLEGRDNYQKRALCFLAERMFNFWCYCKKVSNYKIKEVDMVEHLDFKPDGVNERGDYS